jgi:hypothetical protein
LIIKINQTPIARRAAAAAHFFILSQINYFFTKSVNIAYRRQCHPFKIALA